MEEKEQKFKFPGFPEEKQTWDFPAILNGYVAKLTGAEFKVLWYIVRHTYGWQKTEDAISYRQFEEGIKKKDGEWLDRGTGLGKRAIRQALKSLEERGFIEIIKTRYKGKQGITRYKIRFSKGKSGWDQKENQTGGKKEKETIPIYKTISTKTNIILHSNASVADSIGRVINELIKKFKPINPAYERLFANKTQRAALERLLKKMGQEKLERILDILPVIFGKAYAPRITTPLKLEEKLADLFAYLKERSEIGGKVFVIKKSEK